MMNMKKVIKYAVALALVIAMVGCGSDVEADEPDVPSPEETAIGTVSIDILYPAEAGLDNIAEGQADIYEEADTVLDALKAYGEANELAVVVEKGTFTYVTGIGGVFEKDYGDTTGWVFTVNGEAVMEGAAECTLSDGDTVAWEYVDYSQMETTM